jgi:hypothetical protein
MGDLKGELQQLADDAACQARPLPVDDVIRQGDRRHRRTTALWSQRSARTPRTARPRWRLALIPLCAAAAIAAIAVGTVAVRSGSGVQVPRRAASRPAVRPGQWVYRKMITQNPPGDHAEPRFFITTMWSTADDTKQAFYWDAKRGGLVNRGAKLHVVRALPSMRPLVPYRAIGSLPTDPRALVTYLRHLAQHSIPKGLHRHLNSSEQDSFVFRTIGTMLTSYIMPPRFTAELFHALGNIPRVTIDQDAVDVIGQRGVGFLGGTVPSQEIILSRRTYTYIGGYAFGRFGGTALLRQAFVSGPGVRP